MLYHISRNGQMYGPYTLEQLRSFVLSGNVLPTDLAKSDAMPEWLPVEQLLGTSGSAGSAAPGFGAAPPVYPSAGGYPGANADAFPDPPNLPWGLVLLFNVLSCGLFIAIWNIVMAAWMRRVQPASNALFYYIGGAVLTLGSSGSFLAMQQHHHIYNQHPFAGLVAITGWVLRLIARFTMKADLEQHFNGPEPLGLQMSPVLTFFFGGLYIQSQLNRINDIKNAVRFRAHGVVR